MTLDSKALIKHKVNFKQINLYLKKANGFLSAAKANIEINGDVAFTTAYDSMLTITQALMLSHGYRPRKQMGHHQTLVEFSKQVLGPKFHLLTSTYSRMRRKRNNVIYEAESVAITEAKEAVKYAEKYYIAVENKIASDNPQQKLWKA